MLAAIAAMTDPLETPLAMFGLATLWQLAVVGSIAFAARAGWHRGLDDRTRRAWRVILVAMVVLAISTWIRGAHPVGQTFPSVADMLRLAFVPILLAGLAFLRLRWQSRQDRHKVWLDTGIVVTAAGMLLWYLVVEPTVSGRELSAPVLAAALAYPAGDLALIFAAVLVLLRGAASSVRRPVSLLAAGILCLTLGDIYMGYLAAHGTSFAAQPWQFTCWLLGAMLLCVAGYEQCRQTSGHRLTYEERAVRPVTRLPYLAIVLGYALLLTTTWRLGLPAVSGLVIGAMLLTALVAGRQILAQRETHEFAVTDPLTGLVNRKRLHDALRLALTRGSRSGQHVAVLLLDLNGLKQVNDTLGHEAGDQLLIAFGQLLRRNVLGADVVGRLGGDEFAAVLHNIGSPADALAVAERIMADLRQPVVIANAPVQPSASVGIVIAAPGELSAEESMRRADLAMYRAKRARTTGYEMYGAEQGPAPGTVSLPTAETTLER